MKKKQNKSGNISRHITHVHERCSDSAIYGLGFIGALVYYITTATSLWAGIVGFFKAILWPAFLVFELMKFLGM